MTLPLPWPDVRQGDVPLEAVQQNFEKISIEWPQAIGVWTEFTPTLTQSVTVTATVGYSRYMKIGRMVVWSFRLNATSAGTATNAIRVSIPVSASTSGGYIVGSGYVYDSSATTVYQGAVSLQSTSTVEFYRDGASNAPVGASVTLDSGDVVTGFVTYEAAA